MKIRNSKIVWFWSMLLSITGTIATSCSTDDEPSSGVENENAKLELTDAEKASVAEFNTMGMNMFCAFMETDAARDKANVGFSPLSASEALAMLVNAAKADEYSKELVRKFGFESIDALNDYNKKLMAYLPHKVEGNKLSFVNSFFYNQKLSLTAPFINKMKDYYSAGIMGVDFASSATADVINNWASDNTNGLIPNIVTPDTYNPETSFILANALYFAGEWANKFDKENTSYKPFTSEDGKTVMVPMMTQEERFEIMDDLGIRGIRMNYKGKKRYMECYLPREGQSVYDLVEEFSNGTYDNMYSRFFRPGVGTVTIPKFELAFNTMLEETLAGCDIHLGKLSFGDYGIPVNTRVKMKQFVSVKVDEEGSVMAAVTTAGGDWAVFPTPFEYTFDRPFLYIIKDTESNAILMAGVVTNPLK